MTTILILVLIALQILDAWTTLKILSQGGREANPVMAKVFEITGPEIGLLIKGVLVSAAGYFILIDHLPVLASLCLVYVAVVIHNFRQIK